MDRDKRIAIHEGIDDTYAAPRIALLMTEYSATSDPAVDAFAIPAAWDEDDINRFLNAHEHDWAAVTTLQDVPEEYR